MDNKLCSKRGTLVSDAVTHRPIGACRTRARETRQAVSILRALLVRARGEHAVDDRADQQVSSRLHLPWKGKHGSKFPWTCALPQQVSFPIYLQADPFLSKLCEVSHVVASFLLRALRSAVCGPRPRCAGACACPCPSAPRPTRSPAQGTPSRRPPGATRAIHDDFSRPSRDTAVLIALAEELTLRMAVRQA